MESTRIVLVAGGTGALGRAIALAFLETGATVAVTYRRKQEYDELEHAAGKNRSRIRGVPVDANDENAVQAAVAKLVKDTGRLDVLVNAIGGFAGGAKTWETDVATYERMLDLNVRPGLVLVRAALPVMLRQKRGWVVNIASRAGFGKSAGAAVYAASKAAALALFDSLAEEVKETPIRVNSVVPSVIDTPANRESMPKADHTQWPKPEEIARVVVFLCSEEAKLIHGAAVPVYGGT